MGIETVPKTLSETIPNKFVRSETEKPGITTIHGQVLEVPLIYLSNPGEEMVRRGACFQMVNHEISSEVISKLQAVGKEFFDLIQEEKEVHTNLSGSKSVKGYGKKGWVDHLFHKIWPPLQPLTTNQFWSNPTCCLQVVKG